ncbi:ras-related protein Rab-34-like [Neocloeon triangulifer]|uniref:ras-related protein Rab-34-like n=1 Tax=Neocloeon triangulifer TaxID=2078957 RepID=UPI00286F7673|nr:ras-related protein Rab-34-like [Neocloeon triangulifer]
MQKFAETDRQIFRFPVAFRNDATLYSGQTDFSPGVRDACKMSKVQVLRLAKIVFVGDCGVGKTCLINRFCKRIFDSNYKATIGVDFEVERFDVLGVAFNLQMWDTAGQERFRSIASSYYRGAHALVVVFDMTNLLSLAHCHQWLEEAMTANCRGPKPLVFLVGTKKDLMGPASQKMVEAQAVQMSKELGAELWLLSACTGDNVLDFFFRLTALNFDRSVLRELERDKVDIKIGYDFVSPKRPVKIAEKNKSKRNNCQGQSDCKI